MPDCTSAAAAAAVAAIFADIPLLISLLRAEEAISSAQASFEVGELR